MMLLVLQLCFVGKLNVLAFIRSVCPPHCHVCIDFFTVIIFLHYVAACVQLHWSRAVVLVSSGVVQLGGMHHRLHNAKKIKKLMFCSLSFPARTCANMASRSSWTCVAPSGIP